MSCPKTSKEEEETEDNDRWSEDSGDDAAEELKVCTHAHHKPSSEMLYVYKKCYLCMLL